MIVTILFCFGRSIVVSPEKCCILIHLSHYYRNYWSYELEIFTASVLVVTYTHVVEAALFRCDHQKNKLSFVGTSIIKMFFTNFKNNLFCPVSKKILTTASKVKLLHIEKQEKTSNK